MKQFSNFSLVCITGLGRKRANLYFKSYLGNKQANKQTNKRHYNNCINICSGKSYTVQIPSKN
jgi:hypothetical protein